MNRLTAYEARTIADSTKPENIYGEIGKAAVSGDYCYAVQFLTEFAFKRLVEDGYRIYVLNDTVEMKKYDEVAALETKEFLITWED